MDKNKVQLETLQSIKETGILKALIDVYSSKLGIEKDDAEKIINNKVNARLKSIVTLFDTNVSAESIKNNITNSELDEYLKNKPVIKG